MVSAVRDGKDGVGWEAVRSSECVECDSASGQVDTMQRVFCAVSVVFYVFCVCCAWSVCDAHVERGECRVNGAGVASGGRHLVVVLGDHLDVDAAIVFGLWCGGHGVAGTVLRGRCAYARHGQKKFETFK